MSNNALEKVNRTSIAAGGPIDPYAAAAADMAGSAATYMKFNGNSGEYTIGQDAEEIPEGSRLAVNMPMFKKGWICWKDSEVVEEIMLAVRDGKQPPERHELTDHGPYVTSDDQNDGWSQQVSVVFRNLKTGEEYTYKTSSKSAYRSLGALLTDFSRQYKFHENEIPIVELASTPFTVKNKKFGKKYAPNIKIVEWVAESALIEQVDGKGDNPESYDEQPAAQAALPAPAAEAGDAAEIATAAAPTAEAAPAAATEEKPAPTTPRRGARRTF